MDPTGPGERERWRIAFERCDDGTCCSANTKYHRPRCLRRAAHVEARWGRDGARSERWTPEMESFSEIGGRRGCIQVITAIALITALAMTFSWWVVYG